MGANFKWYGEEAKRHVKGTAAVRLEKAAILVKNACKEELSAPSPPVSDPGEPPHKDTGRLRASVSHEMGDDGQSARVGTNVRYGKWLELGTSKMAPRPWLSATLAKMQDAIKTLLGKG